MITNFRGRYAFLSNFYSFPVEYEGETYPTSEHAFQAAKTLDPVEQRVIRNSFNAREAKKFGRSCTIRPDWDDIKEQVMYDILKDKFAPHKLGFKLLETYPDPLIEGNTWNDRIWGCVLVNGEWVGQNLLGKTLMRIRKELLEDDSV